jgi:hypothetical protein
MGDVIVMNPNSRQWTVVGRLFMIFGALCMLGSISVYYLPGLPRAPRPSTGNVYPFQNHYTVLYWTKAELWWERALSIAAASSWLVGLGIAARLGLLKWRK